MESVVAGPLKGEERGWKPRVLERSGCWQRWLQSVSQEAAAWWVLKVKLWVYHVLIWGAGRDGSSPVAPHLTPPKWGSQRNTSQGAGAGWIDCRQGCLVPAHPPLRCWLPHHLCSTGVLPSFSYIQESVSPLASASFSEGGEEISDTGDDWLRCYGFELLLTIKQSC